ncbi:MAG: AMP-binding protein [Rhizobiales bacterium]|nr:AMP-binding protein [Hyphomicrobiales bacterium]
MLAPATTYDEARSTFAWDVPEALNMGVQILDAPAALNPTAPAIIDGVTGEVATFGELADEAARLCGALQALGAQNGDRVAVIAPQGARTLVVQAAILRAGLISVPLSERYGREALAHRMQDSGARFALVSAAGAASLASIDGNLPDLAHTIALEPVDGALSYDQLLADKGAAVPPADTGPDDPCLMIYTPGTTGPAKGALHGHRVLAGHMPGFLFAHGGSVSDHDVFYTPADWAWAGGLLNLLFPALSLGAPVVSFSDAKGFDPARVAAMMADRGVTHAFLPPTALKLMRASVSDEAMRGIGLRSVMSAGEALGRATYEWAERAFGFAISEAYGQTECNLIIGSSATYGATRAGATGKAVPGHKVFVVREDGTEAEPGELGEIAVRSPDPVMFLGYWKAEQATERKYLTSTTLGTLLMTGDMAMRDVDGFIWFMGRDDDVITSSGHRIGPGEIEDCLTGHPAVAMAAVVGVPDDLRTEIVRAFVVLRDVHEPGEAMADELRAHVRANLAAHEYPRDIRFVDTLPTTTTGKIIRRMLKHQD